jgi:hypothetical protein
VQPTLSGGSDLEAPAVQAVRAVVGPCRGQRSGGENDQEDEHSTESHKTRRRIAPAKRAKSQPRWKLRQLSTQRNLQRLQLFVDRRE